MIEFHIHAFIHALSREQPFTMLELACTFVSRYLLIRTLSEGKYRTEIFDVHRRFKWPQNRCNLRRIAFCFEELTYFSPIFHLLALGTIDSCCWVNSWTVISDIFEQSVSVVIVRSNCQFIINFMTKEGLVNKMSKSASRSVE